MEASMKRIWWPFCLLTLSRRIMCLEELSSAGVRPSAEGRKAPTVRLGRVPSPVCSGWTASKRRARRDTKPRPPDSKSGYHVPSGIQGKGLATEAKKNRPRRCGRGQRWLTKTTPADYAPRAVPTMRLRGSPANPAAAKSRRRQPESVTLSPGKSGRRQNLREMGKKKEAPARVLGPLYHRTILRRLLRRRMLV